jgi:hypothetical protein
MLHACIQPHLSHIYDHKSRRTPQLKLPWHRIPVPGALEHRSHTTLRRKIGEPLGSSEEMEPSCSIYISVLGRSGRVRHTNISITFSNRRIGQGRVKDRALIRVTTAKTDPNKVYFSPMRLSYPYRMYFTLQLNPFVIMFHFRA